MIYSDSKIGLCGGKLDGSLRIVDNGGSWYSRLVSNDAQDIFAMKLAVGCLLLKWNNCPQQNPIIV